MIQELQPAILTSSPRMEPIRHTPPRSALPAPVTPAAKALELLQRLQTTLEIEGGLEHFTVGAAELVPFDGYGYTQSPAAIDCRSGRQSRHSAAYQLRLEQEDLGEIRFYRGRKFVEAELACLEQLLGVLMYPLRNALRYRQALQWAHRDPLTTLGNRAALDEQLQREIKVAQRHDRPLSLLVLDVDRFKQINDRYGHAAGDQVLRHVAGLLKQAVRDTDLAFRYGGEELVVILTNTDRAGALVAAERIRTAIAGQPCRGGSVEAPIEVSVTVSLGVTALGRDDDAVSLFERADRAMYAAKRAGRNRVEAV